MAEYRKKLIEVALPLEAINRESAREKSIRHGHPSTLHLWWARRPLAAARAVLFAQLVADPSSWPELFPTEEEQNRERKRLFNLIEMLVVWKNSNNAAVIDAARLEIARSHARTSSSPKAKIILGAPKTSEVNEYLATELPPVHDPFAGGGTIPLEAQRLGLRAIATDLNPVAVLINKALIEIPPKFAGMPPVNPESRATAAAEHKHDSEWRGAQGLAEDVRYYGRWMRDEAKKRIGHLYPDVEVTAEMAKDRPDLKPYVGKKLTVIAWLWARTVASPNPALGGVHVPLVSSFWLSTKEGKKTWVEPVIERGGRSYRFEIRIGTPTDENVVGAGTKLGRGANFRCVLSGATLEPDFIKAECKAKRVGARLMAIAAEGVRGRVYLPPIEEHARIAAGAMPPWEPEGDLPDDPRNFWTVNYGLSRLADLFTPRQLVALTTFSELVGAAQARIEADVRASAGGVVSRARDNRDISPAIGTYLSLAIARYANACSTICAWNAGEKKEDIRFTFSRQAIPMTWDYAEGNPFSESSGNFSDNIETWVYKAIASLPTWPCKAEAQQRDACSGMDARTRLVSTDPPYYDNIAYADLSDFFYVWLRRGLRDVYPDLLSTMLVPKATELVATPYRHGGREAADAFFLRGMSAALSNLASGAVDDAPLAIYYAFKQSESAEEGTASTGWETFLDAVLSAGLMIEGTWPVRTERAGRSIEIGTNALASSIVLVCRKRNANDPSITRADFRRALRRELPSALKALQQGSIAPVDVAQAAIGPGMGIFSRHSAVIEADGSPMSVRTALQLINEALDEHLTAQEGDVDPDSRFAITWYEANGWNAGKYGDAETLAKARNVSVQGVVEASILHSAAGKVRLLKRSEIPDEYDPAIDDRPTVWEATQHLIKYLDTQGEEAAARLLKKLGATADHARDLAYRLYSTCEKKGWAEDARSYNTLVVAWPELERIAASERLAEVRPMPKAGGQLGLAGVDTTTKTRRRKGRAQAR